ncbi:hypothetical protein Mal35_07180 [Gimesia maris]|uniref:hypothetical protein n=1 Tax=Gimesia maris TaxID=122 RepID=UPI00118C5733|nr:hypothetical protein [Gimesia maris]QDT77292.1 hypothetical protein Mal35_07180 [Gimesia maris]
MSSIEYDSIFDHAAAVVKSECGSTLEVERILDDFRVRALSEERDPLINRNLIVEPMHDAQVLEVSFETLEQVTAQLQRLNILHIWVRARCPSEDDGDDVIETDNPRVFREAISSPCPHCGQLHEDIDWEHLETFYAFHFDKTPDKFKFSNYFRKPQPLPSLSSVRPPFFARVRKWFREGPLPRFFRVNMPSPAETVTLALDTNAPNTLVPSPKETLATLWKRGTLLVFCGLIITFTVSLWSIAWAIIAGAAFLLCFLILAWVTLNAIFAAAYLERRVLTCGYLITVVLLTSSSGISWEGEVTNHPKIQMEQQTPVNKHELMGIFDNLRWNIKLKHGEENPHLIWASVVIFLGTSYIVYRLYLSRMNH